MPRSHSPKGEGFTVLDAIRKDTEHPIDLSGGELHRLLAIVDDPTTRRLRTRGLFDEWPTARAPFWWCENRKDGFSSIWIEGQAVLGDAYWHVGALLTQIETGPTAGFTSVELVIAPPEGDITVVPIPARVVVDWRSFAENEDERSQIGFADQLRARHGLQTARGASSEELLRMTSRAATLDGYSLHVGEAPGVFARWLTLETHAQLADALSSEGALKAFLAGVCVELTEVRFEASVAETLDRALNGTIRGGHAALIGLGAFQRAGFLVCDGRAA